MQFSTFGLQQEAALAIRMDGIVQRQPVEAGVAGFQQIRGGGERLPGHDESVQIHGLVFLSVDSISAVAPSTPATT